MGVLFTPDIDKDFILSRVSEEEIFERYGVPVKQGIFRSPLRKDLHPTCRFYRNMKGKLILHDFAGHFNGDCFDVVMKIKGLKYWDALKDIARTFHIISGAPRHPVMSAITIGPRTLCDIRIKSMPWDDQHLSWWEEYGITRETLDRYDVVQIDRVWLNGALYYNRGHARGEVVFAYKFGLLDYKVYFPTRSKTRFLHNNPDLLQGYNQLVPTISRQPLIVITKAMKDVMCLHEYGIPAIAPMSETSVVSDSVLDDLKEQYEHVFALYDRDRVGKCALLNFKKRGVTPLLMPKGTTKDFSDLCKKDLRAAGELVQNTLELYDIQL
jgi:hypothetical protein